MMLKEAVVTKFKVLSLHVPRRSETMKNLSVYLVFKPGFQTWHLQNISQKRHCLSQLIL
jgi:hypothetical protein